MSVWSRTKTAMGSLRRKFLVPLALLAYRRPGYQGQEAPLCACMRAEGNITEKQESKLHCQLSCQPPPNFDLLAEGAPPNTAQCSFSVNDYDLASSSRSSFAVPGQRTAFPANRESEDPMVLDRQVKRMLDTAIFRDGIKLADEWPSFAEVESVTPNDFCSRVLRRNLRQGFQGGGA